MRFRVIRFLFVFILILLCGNLSAQTLEQFQADAEKAMELIQAEKFDEAAAVTKKLLQQAKDEFANKAVAAYQLYDLGGVYKNKSRFDEAAACLLETIAIDERVYGKDSTDVAYDLCRLGNIYTDQGHYTEAEPLHKRALEICETKSGKDHTDTAWSLNSLAWLYYKQGCYTEAEPLYKRTLEIREEKLGKEHPNTIQSVNDLADTYWYQGRYAEAELFYKRALEIREAKLGKEHPDTAYSMNELAWIYKIQGRYAEAELFYKRALDIREAKLGKDHPDTAYSLNDLALLYSEQGRYAEAEPFYKRSLEIHEKVLGKDHSHTAAPLNNLALLYVAQGRYAEAEPLYKQTLEIKEAKFGKDHPSTARSLNNLAWLYVVQSRYTEAVPLYKQSLEIRETKLGRDHLDTAYSLNDLAWLYVIPGLYAEAEPLYKRSLEIHEKVLGKDHSHTAATLNNLALLYAAQGRYAEAEPLCNRAIAIFDANPTSADSGQRWYVNRSRLYKATNHPNKAIVDLKRAMDLSLEVRKNASGTDIQRAQTFEGYYHLFETMVSWQYEFAQNNNGHYDMNEAYEAMELSRGRGLQDMIDMQGFDLLQGVEEDLAGKLREEEQNARTASKSAEREMELFLQGESKNDDEKKEELEAKLKAGYQRLVNAEAAIRNASPIYREFFGKDRRPVPPADAEKQLKTDQCLAFEYLLGSEASYLLVYGFGREKPTLFPLQVDDAQAALFGVDPGPVTAKKLQAMFQNEQGTGVLQLVAKTPPPPPDIKKEDYPKDSPRRFEERKNRWMEAYFRDFSQEIRDARELHEKLIALWPMLVPDETLRAEITSPNDSPKRLLILPDGALAKLPFEMLVVNGDAEKPAYLLDQNPSTAYAPSMSFYYNLSRRAVPKAKKALTVGNPNYSKPEEKPEDDSFGSIRRKSLLGRFGSLSSLPLTAMETENVMQACLSVPMEVKRFDAESSTEKNVRENVRGRTLVHLSCHGIAFEEYGNMSGCLALTVGDKDDSSDDGFLELREIFSLDLKSCELAILSACDTNLGANQSGEGTWSLSRGVLVAGSRRVVTSNWQVAEKVTADLIGDFVWKTSPAGGRDYAVALREAQREIRVSAKTAHPYYWASFVLVGMY